MLILGFSQLGMAIPAFVVGIALSVVVGAVALAAQRLCTDLEVIRAMAVPPDSAYADASGSVRGAGALRAFGIHRCHQPGLLPDRACDRLVPLARDRTARLRNARW